MNSDLECSSCGAPLHIASVQSLGSIRCQYCGKIVKLPKQLKTDSIEPGILFQADLNDPNLTGWEKVNPTRLSIQTGTNPELRATFPPSERVHFILKTSGYLDDQDMRVKIRFLEGNVDHVHAGLCARYEDGIGGYCILISAQRFYIIGYYVKPVNEDLLWKAIMNWRFHSALKAGLKETNELRVVLKGEQLSVYLNGVLATSIKDKLFSKGQSHLAIEPGNKFSATAAFSDVIILEA